MTNRDCHVISIVSSCLFSSSLWGEGRSVPLTSSGHDPCGRVTRLGLID